MADESWLVVFSRKRNVVLVFLTVLFTYCEGCSPSAYETPDMVTKFHFSTHVVYGKVRAIYRGLYDYSTLYTTEMEVRCVFQGGPIPPVINITYSGYEPGLCRSNNYTVGGLYIAYLDDAEGNGVYRSASGFEEDVADDQMLDDVPLICGVIVDYPTGVNQPVDWVCPESYPDYEMCLEYKEQTLPPVKLDMTPPTKQPAADAPIHEHRENKETSRHETVLVAGFGGDGSHASKTALSSGICFLAFFLLFL